MAISFKTFPWISIYCGDCRRYNYKRHGFRRGRASAPSLFIYSGDSHHLDLRFQASIISSLAISTSSAVGNSDGSAAQFYTDTGFCLWILLLTGHDNKSYTEHTDRFWPSSMLVSRANKSVLKVSLLNMLCCKPPHPPHPPPPRVILHPRQAV